MWVNPFAKISEFDDFRKFFKTAGGRKFWETSTSNNGFIVRKQYFLFISSAEGGEKYTFLTEKERFCIKTRISFPSLG